MENSEKKELNQAIYVVEEIKIRRNIYNVALHIDLQIVFYNRQKKKIISEKKFYILYRQLEKNQRLKAGVTKKSNQHSRSTTPRRKIYLIYSQNKPCKVLPKTMLAFSKNLVTFPRTLLGSKMKLIGKKKSSDFSSY